MANPVVQSKTTSGSGTTISVTLTTPAVAGDILVVVANSINALNTPTGFTARASFVSDQGFYIWDKTATGGETQIDVTQAGPGNTAVTCLELDKNYSVQTFDVRSNVNGTSAANNVTTNAVTGTDLDGDYCLCVVAFHGWTTAPVFGSITNGFTALVTNTPVWTGASAMGHMICSKNMAYGVLSGTAVNYTNNVDNNASFLVMWGLGQAVVPVDQNVIYKSTTKSIADQEYANLVSIYGSSPALSLQDMRMLRYGGPTVPAQSVIGDLEYKYRGPGTVLSLSDKKLSMMNNYGGSGSMADGENNYLQSAVRTNLATNPRAVGTSGNDGWTPNRWFGGSPGAGTYSYITNVNDHPAGITTCRRKTWTVAPSHNGDTGYEIYTSYTPPKQCFPASPGQTITISGWLKPSRGPMPGNAQIYAYSDSAVTETGNLKGADVSCPAGVWTRVSVTYTMPAGTTGIRAVLDIDVGGPMWQPGDILDGTGLLIEQSSTLGSYFDGDTQDSAQVQSSWKGVPNNSISTANATATLSQYTQRTNLANNPRAISTANNGWFTSRWFGSGGVGTYSFLTGQTGPAGTSITSCLRKAWTTAPSGNGDTGFDIAASPTAYFPVTPGQTYTVSTWMRQSSTTAKTAHLQLYGFDQVNSQGATTNANNSTNLTDFTLPSGNVWTRCSATWQIPQTIYGLKVTSDVDAGTAWAAGDTLDCTGLLIEKVGVLDTFFDGDTSSTAQNIFQWLGDSNASNSVALVNASGVAVLNPIADGPVAAHAIWAGDPSWQNGKPLTGGYVTQMKNGGIVGGDLVQALAGRQPVYKSADPTMNNVPTVTFDGIDDWMQVDTPDIALPYYIVIICSKGAGAGPRRVMGGGASSTNGLGVSGGNFFSATWGGNIVSNIPNAPGNYMLVAKAASPSPYFTVNGIEDDAVITNSTDPFNVFMLGAGGLAGTQQYFWDGAVAFVGVYTSDPRLDPKWNKLLDYAKSCGVTGLMGIADSFNRADNATSVGTAETGGTWSAQGTWGIISNTLYNPGAVNGNRVLLPWTTNDCDISCIAAALPSTAGFGLLGRYADANNYVYLSIISNGSFQIGQNIAGTFTGLLTSAAGVIAAGNRVTLRMSGSTLTALVNGVAQGSATTGLLSGSVNVGVRNTGDTAGAFRIDNFQVTY